MAHNFQVGETLRYADKILRVWPEYEKKCRFCVIHNDGLFDLVHVEVLVAPAEAITVKQGDHTWMDAGHFERANIEYIPELAHIDSDGRFDIDI